MLLRRRLDCPVSERAPPRPNAGDLQILAIAKISPPELATRVVLAAVPPDSHTLPLLPRRNTRPESVDYHRHFMSGNTGILNAGPGAFFREYVTVANTISLHLDTHLSCTGVGNRAFDDLEICSGFGNLGHLHGCVTLSVTMNPPINLQVRNIRTAASGRSCDEESRLPG